MSSTSSIDSAAQAPAAAAADVQPQPKTALARRIAPPSSAPRELGGRKDGTEPTRYGDWEKHGRCIDF